MNDRDLAAYLDYMRAQIRVQDARVLAQLSNAQLHDAFHMLPRPTVSFREWLQRTGRTAFTTEHTEKDSEQSSVASVFSVGQSNPQAEAQVEAQNAKGLAALRALQAQGFPVAISTES